MSQQGCSLLLEAGHVRNHGKLRLNEREILFTSDPPRPSSLQHCLHPTMRFFERRKASQTEIGRSLDESVPGGSSVRAYGIRFLALLCACSLSFGSHL